MRVAHRFVALAVCFCIITSCGGGGTPFSTEGYPILDRAEVGLNGGAGSVDYLLLGTPADRSASSALDAYLDHLAGSGFSVNRSDPQAGWVAATGSRAGVIYNVGFAENFLKMGQLQDAVAIAEFGDSLSDASAGDRLVVTVEG